MLLITGAAGSGKTSLVLDGLRQALRQKNSHVRLLTPTATMAQHLRNRMAREGFVFRPELIQTLSRFIEPWTSDLREISNPAFYLLVEETVRRIGRPEFAKVAHMPGFCARVARAIQECASAGCSAGVLAENLREAPLGEPFVAVYSEVERELERRKAALRSGRLGRASARIAETGLAGIETIWIDGFFSFTDPELSLVKAAMRFAELTVSLPQHVITRASRDRLLAMGFTERILDGARAQPDREIVVAPTIEREADEIARRIIVQISTGGAEVASGAKFRDIGIIVRSPEIYVPVLRATFERFGIPARFYFGSELTEHPAARFLAGVVDAMLGGWDHAEALTVLKMAPFEGARNIMDRFEIKVRSRMPGRGLQALAEHGDGIRLLEAFSKVDEWRSLALSPLAWSERLLTLRSMFHPTTIRDGVTHQAALEWRRQAAVLDSFDAAIAEAAAAFPTSQPVPLAPFWKAVKSVLRLTPLRVADQRRDVVHVLDVHEARQWELPVVFVCGMVEKQFPQYHAQDAFLPDAARRHLQQSGIRLRTAADIGGEEEFLFDSAITRATRSLVLSYPRCDARGEQNLPSLFLDRVNGAASAVAGRAVRPQPLFIRRGPKPAANIHSPDLLQTLSKRYSPTALEKYLQCPFQFFALRTLKLEKIPQRAEDRLDFLIQGGIVHSVMAQWHATRQPVDSIFDRVFQETCQKEAIPGCYRTALLRYRMLQDLRALVADTRMPPASDSLAEQSFEWELQPGVLITGRIDRLDKLPGGRAVVVDYKYSLNLRERLNNENFLQGPLYLLALEHLHGLDSAGMVFCSPRGGEVTYAGWGEIPGLKLRPFTREWMQAAAVKTIQAVGEIAGGRVAPHPFVLEPCRYCDVRDVCRYETAARSLVAIGAGIAADS